MLAQQLGATFVPEHLRDWCLARGRTPRVEEQAAIAAEQARCIAAAGPGQVVADTSALMTAVYSLHYFGDARLLAGALDQQRRYKHTLVCSPDGIAWEPAEGLRDGDAARQAVHTLLIDLLDREKLSYTLLSGSLQNRLQTALDLLRP